MILQAGFTKQGSEDQDRRRLPRPRVCVWVNKRRRAPNCVVWSRTQSRTQSPGRPSFWAPQPSSSLVSSFADPRSLASKTTAHPALIPQEVAGTSRRHPQIPAPQRCEHLLTPAIPADSPQPGSVMTGLSRRRSRVRVPSLPFLHLAVGISLHGEELPLVRNSLEALDSAVCELDS
jgi:hypothetical protein